MESPGSACLKSKNQPVSSIQQCLCIGTRSRAGSTHVESMYINLVRLVYVIVDMCFRCTCRSFSSLGWAIIDYNFYSVSHCTLCCLQTWQIIQPESSTMTIAMKMCWSTMAIADMLRTTARLPQPQYVQQIPVGCCSSYSYPQSP